MIGILSAMATKLFTCSYSAPKEMRVENVPAPAIIGNANGTIDEALSAPSFCLKIFMPNTISMAMKKSMNEPATAKEFTSTPNKYRKRSPRNRNTIINRKETNVVVIGWMFPVEFLILTIMGTLPTMSITANKTIKHEPISFQSNMGRNYNGCALESTPLYKSSYS